MNISKSIFIFFLLVFSLSIYAEKHATYLQDRNGVKFEVNQESGFTGIY